MTELFFDRFAAVAERHASRTAILDRGVPTTYEDLFDRACRAGGALVERGLGAESIVGVAIEKSADYVVACLGAWAARAAFMPDGERVDLAVSAAPDGPRARRRGEPGDLAYVIATSGSTGTAREVMVEHRGLVPMLDAQIGAFDLHAGDRSLWMLARTFDASISDIGTALLSGATLCIEDDAALRDPARLSALLAARDISYVDLPPALLPHLDETRAPPSLRTIVVGGEVCDPAAIRRWARRVRVVNVYGPTEATVCTSLGACDAESWDRPLLGAPLPTVEYRVEDDELFIGGPCLARGYRGDPERTAERFVVRDGRRWFRTRDRVRERDGSLEFVGRMDRVVKRHGKWTLLGESPRVAECDRGRAATTDLERRLASLFASVFGTEVGCDAGFGALGGDSVMLVALVARARAAGLELSPELVAREQTVERIAARIGDTGTLSTAALRDELARIEPLPSRAGAPGADVFLTGATGSLGSRVLRELLATGVTVRCLVRARRLEDARSRLARSLGFELPERVVVSLGDLEAPRFGLDDRAYAALGRVGAIHHCGARVSLAADVGTLWRSNVLGTNEILRLQAISGATLHYASTLSVFVSADAREGTFFEADDLRATRVVHGGYAQSKWAAETLVRERARGPVFVYRFGLLTGGARGELLSMTIRGLAALGAIPADRDRDLAFDVTPIDRAASAMMEIASKGAAGTYHLANRRAARLDDLLVALGRAGVRIDEVGHGEWIARASAAVSSSSDLDLAAACLALRSSLARERTPFDLFQATRARFDMARTEEVLGGPLCPDAVDVLDGCVRAALEQR
jgi:thioester reductase-like protein